MVRFEPGSSHTAVRHVAARPLQHYYWIIEPAQIFIATSCTINDMFIHHHNHHCLTCLSMWDLLVTFKLLSDEIYELLVAVVQVLLNAVLCTMQINGRVCGPICH